jgi:hypothetical protein
MVFLHKFHWAESLESVSRLARQENVSLLLAYFSYIEKIKESLWEHRDIFVSVNPRY